MNNYVTKAFFFTIISVFRDEAKNIYNWGFQFEKSAFQA